MKGGTLPPTVLAEPLSLDVTGNRSSKPASVASPTDCIGPTAWIFLHSVVHRVFSVLEKRLSSDNYCPPMMCRFVGAASIDVGQC
jgi:hypothetical protein